MIHSSHKKILNNLKLLFTIGFHSSLHPIIRLIFLVLLFSNKKKTLNFFKMKIKNYFKPYVRVLLSIFILIYSHSYYYQTL